MRGLPFLLLALCVASCSQNREHTASAVEEKDSVSMMISYGVNTLISDSGIIKYRIVAERWDVNTVRNPQRWTFITGIFMEQFDENFNIKAYVYADTAWYYDKLRLWELRGRVKVRNVNGMVFRGEELFWDGSKHEMYSNKYSRVTTPERDLAGTYFWSDENMEKYTVSNSKGSFVKTDIDSDDAIVDDEAIDMTESDSTSVDSVEVAEESLRPKDTKRAAAVKPDSVKKLTVE